MAEQKSDLETIYTHIQIQSAPNNFLASVLASIFDTCNKYATFIGLLYN